MAKNGPKLAIFGHFAISCLFWKCYNLENLLWIFLQMADIASNRVGLNFEKKLAKSLEPFLRYLMFFLGNFWKPVFCVFLPRLVRIFINNLLRSSIFKLSFERVVAELVKGIFRRVIAILVFCGYSKKVCVLTRDHDEIFGGKFFLVGKFFFQFFFIFA